MKITWCSTSSGSRPQRVGPHHRVGGQVVGQVGQATLVADARRRRASSLTRSQAAARPVPRPAGRGPWPTPARSNARTSGSTSSAPARRDGAGRGGTTPSRCRPPPRAPGTRPRGSRWRRSTGGPPPGGCRTTAVADAVDLVAHRLGVVAAADEVGPQRVGHEAVVDRLRRGLQALGHDLTPVETTPRILRAGAHERVGAVRGQVEDLGTFTA